MINIPGMMVGQLVAGTPIMQAVIYQQCIMFMITASSMFGVIMSVAVSITIRKSNHEKFFFNVIMIGLFIYSY